MQKLQEDNALESNKLIHWLPVPNSHFHGFVESEDRHKGNSGGESCNDSDPDVSKVELIGGCAVRACHFGNFGGDEENELDNGKLKDA